MNDDAKFLEPAALGHEIGIITGTRPGIIMAAPVIRECVARGTAHFVIHSDQHYSANLDARIFEELELPAPAYRLEGVRNKQTHGAQTAAMLEGIERILLDRRPAVMLVFGDTNSNLAAALAARKLHIAVAHAEAGERSHDWESPEEHNRRMIDVISDYLFVTNRKSADNLRREGIPEARIFETGNPIVDAAVQNITKARQRQDTLARYGLSPAGYALMTLHREENVDREERLRDALAGAAAAARAVGLGTLLFVAHPRTLKRLRQFGLEDWLEALAGIRTVAAVGYLDFLNLLANAALVFTDSGGVQQEACIQRVPCVTLSKSTAWRETLDCGANRLAGCDPDRIRAAASEAMADSGRDWGWPFGKGDAGKRMIDILEAQLAGNETSSS